MKAALVTGVTGQDGSYMAELLLNKGYKVYGLARRSFHDPYQRIQHLRQRIHIVDGDLSDQASIDELFIGKQIDEVYNFAGQSFAPVTWNQAVGSSDIIGLGVARILESIRKFSLKTRFYQASSSEMFGKVRECPQNENTPFRPRNPYGAAKVYGHHITGNYRDFYGIFAVSGICFNHESPRRGEEFVTRKISVGAAQIKLGLAAELRMGSLEARRDWGFAGDFVEAMWLMLQQEKPEDFVLSTGESHTIQECVETAFDEAGLDWKKYVVIDPRFVRPTEDADLLRGDSTKARQKLGWSPKVRFDELIRIMVRADIERIGKKSEVVA
jgi:GDPmannose 4,6-dehydratase